MRTRPRILLVEDDRSIGHLVKRMLENCELEVITAGDGFAAIDACRQWKMDLILMDIRMPDMDGYETSARIRQSQAEHCDVPIIAMTASICDIEFHDYGIDACVEKPLNTFELYNIINERLGAVCRI